RIILLYAISWIVGFDKPLIRDFFGLDISVRDLILFAGGLFLIYKSTFEIHDKLEGPEDDANKGVKLGIVSAIIQIVLLDIVFSFDSILTAIGLVEDPSRDILIMVVAVVISLFIMLLFARPISDFVNNHPTIKMLALSFLLMIGLLLVAEGFHKHIPKGYIYFAMSFSLFVEMLNLRSRKKAKEKVLKLRNQPHLEDEENLLKKPEKIVK
ncbi:MAG TPA: TerC family protein, partial [Cytophagaceae bacterium]